MKKCNQSGCMDLTAFYALKSVAKAEKRKRHTKEKNMRSSKPAKSRKEGV